MIRYEESPLSNLPGPGNDAFHLYDDDRYLGMVLRRSKAWDAVPSYTGHETVRGCRSREEAAACLIGMVNP